MATHLVPYNTAMHLGSGFNSYTQTLCVDHAVVREPEAAGQSNMPEVERKEVAQSVTYKTSIIDKATDVTDEMLISGAFNVKYDQLQVKGDGDFISSSKIKDSDVSIMVSVKVVNQTIKDHSLTKFQPLTNFKDASAQRLIEVYGDSFISGWQEGGEFLAVISIKAKNREEAQVISAEAKIAFTRNKEPTPENNKKDLTVDINASFNKIKKDIAAENEVTVAVTWTGGGQQLKNPEDDWTFDTMKEVALKFPDLCARTPMRTHALLTKYTALRSFYTGNTFDLPVYDKTGTYTNILQEAYHDYKAIIRSIQVLAFDVSEGTKALAVNPRSAKAVEQAKGTSDKISGMGTEQTGKETAPGTLSDAESVESNVVEIPAPSKVPIKVITPPPPTVDTPFPATVTGLEEARLKCRFMMNRIVQEIDNITLKPEIATDESRPSPYISPFIFKMLLPLAVDLPAESSPAAQTVVASRFDADAFAEKYVAPPK